MNHDQGSQQEALELPGWLIGLGSLLVSKELKMAMEREAYDLLEGLASFGEAAA